MRQLLRLEVVLEEGHRERQGDAGTEAARIDGQPAVDDRAGQRPAAGVDTGHAEQPQDRPLLPDRGATPGAARAPSRRRARRGP